MLVAEEQPSARVDEHRFGEVEARRGRQAGVPILEFAKYRLGRWRSMCPDCHSASVDEIRGRAGRNRRALNGRDVHAGSSGRD